jgi:hypothetical protein
MCPTPRTVGRRLFQVSSDATYRPRFDRFLRAALGPARAADPVHAKGRRLTFGSHYWMNTLDGDQTRALS